MLRVVCPSVLRLFSLLYHFSAFWALCLVFLCELRVAGLFERHSSVDVHSAAQSAEFLSERGDRLTVAPCAFFGVILSCDGSV